MHPKAKRASDFQTKHGKQSVQQMTLEMNRKKAFFFFNEGMEGKTIGILSKQNCLNFKVSCAKPVRFYKMMLIQRSYLISSATAITKVDATMTALINRID